MQKSTSWAFQRNPLCQSMMPSPLRSTGSPTRLDRCSAFFVRPNNAPRHPITCPYLILQGNGARIWMPYAKVPPQRNVWLQVLSVAHIFAAHYKSFTVGTVSFLHLFNCLCSHSATDTHAHSLAFSRLSNTMQSAAKSE